MADTPLDDLQADPLKDVPEDDKDLQDEPGPSAPTSEEIPSASADTPYPSIESTLPHWRADMCDRAQMAYFGSPAFLKAADTYSESDLNGRTMTEWTQPETLHFIANYIGSDMKDVAHKGLVAMITEWGGVPEVSHSDAIEIIDKILRDMDRKGMPPFDAATRDTPEVRCLRKEMRKGPSKTYKEAKARLDMLPDVTHRCYGWARLAQELSDRKQTVQMARYELEVRQLTGKYDDSE